MSDFTLEEKIGFAEGRAREKIAEQHFYDIGKATYRCTWFSVQKRNTHHWDVAAPAVSGRASAWLASHPGGQTSDKDGSTERAFRIRGEPGRILVMDERWDPTRPHPREHMTFKSVAAAMLWISDELMAESPLLEGNRA